MPRVLPVVWHQLLWLSQAIGAAATGGHAAEAALGVVQIILLLLPWVGSLLLLGMMAHRPVRAVLTRWVPARSRGGGRNAVSHGASCGAADHVAMAAGGDPGGGGLAGGLPGYVG